jgi:serine/threonine protein kinase
VYELAEKGSLDKYLKDDLGRSRIGSFRRRVQIAIDVMTAIQFLHIGNDQIKACFHRDVKSANIVLRRDFTAQLIDCGLAQFVNDDIQLSSTGIKGTKGYICPQYVRTCEYSAACDVYSFGVVMLELWTGRIQNQKDESGANFNFGEEYIHEDRDVNADADPAMDLGSPLPEFARRFADMALQCINERSKHRSSGDNVLKSLKAILDECSRSSDNLQVCSISGDAVSTSSGETDVCITCRTFNKVPQHSICALCLCREESRKAFSAIISLIVSQSSGVLATEVSARVVQDLGKKLDPKLNDISRQMDDMSGKIDSTLPVLAHLDRRLNNQVPRTFVLLPGNIKSGWQNPRSWLRSTAQKKYYLFFVCPVSQQAVSPPIKLKVAKDWFRKAAPVLATGLFLLQLGLKTGLNVSLALDGAAADLIYITSDHMRQVLDELSSILKDCGDDGLLDRLRSGGSVSGSGSPGLSEKDVRELSGDAYELVVEKACEQDGWRSQMEPVRLPPSPQVFWVSKAVAQDPKYEIVKA